ncbi:hypothetical protein GYMLUDRAFT_249436 [Collybiopsis luxurians FD-317 M1]|uniref:Uncharacterized protein n=1 Tax=Collybiopsis luxurians FD-317 M1 TaxID=944289 RepID=A0A0D0CHY3_9AGAR|nr:hypothetical protein GYMLUDRAFT_249436 [Collybiopsis luxurians FD-317 M1]
MPVTPVADSDESARGLTAPTSPALGASKMVKFALRRTTGLSVVNTFQSDMEAARLPRPSTAVTAFDFGSRKHQKASPPTSFSSEAQMLSTYPSGLDVGYGSAPGYERMLEHVGSPMSYQEDIYGRNGYGSAPGYERMLEHVGSPMSHQEIVTTQESAAKGSLDNNGIPPELEGNAHNNNECNFGLEKHQGCQADPLQDSNMDLGNNGDNAEYVFTWTENPDTTIKASKAIVNPHH